MNRRQLVQAMAAISGHALFPTVLTSFLSGCRNTDMAGYQPVFFSPGDFGTIQEIIDIILPATQTAAASQANTHVFLDQVFAQCLSPEEQRGLKAGMAELFSGFRKAGDKAAFVTATDKDAYSNNEHLAYFKTLKQYTLIGYFTSQEGETKASAYVKIPGDYKADIPAGDRTLNYGKTSLHY